MQLFCTTIMIILSFSCFTQENYYAITNNSDLILVDHESCSTSTVCNCGFYIQDIALTPNHKMYASNGKNIFEIDLSDCSNTLITTSPVTDTFPSSGQWINSLVALDDHFLFAVGTNAILYKINIDNGTSQIIDTLIEKINGAEYWYGSGGDLTWYKGKLLLVTAMNELVEIKMTPSYDYIYSVHRIGIIQTPGHSVYGAITLGSSDCQSDDLKVIGFEGPSVYLINPSNAHTDSLCTNIFNGAVYGATSLSEVQNQIYHPIVQLPNIFTPNSDGINDCFAPIDFSGVSEFECFVLNRWGNTVYYSKNETINWNGLSNENILVEGVYFYVIHYSDYCGINYKVSGSLTLVK